MNLLPHLMMLPHPVTLPQRVNQEGSVLAAILGRPRAGTQHLDRVLAC